MNVKNIALITGLLCSVVVPANAATVVPVTVNGTSYNITTIVGSYNANSTQLSSEPWFGSSSAATSFASALGTLLGTPNSGSGGPFFAYDSIVNTRFYFTAGGSVFSTTISPPTSVTYAVVASTAVPEPLNVLGSVVGLAMLGTVSSRLKARK